MRYVCDESKDWYKPVNTPTTSRPSDGRTGTHVDEPRKSRGVHDGSVSVVLVTEIVTIVVPLPSFVCIPVGVKYEFPS